jgi:NADH-quinone oxidoreductase subunit E|tara:strand:- start:199 stop:693 length:495 start_codon:yes stop_codon:yes gene_type:complete
MSDTPIEKKVFSQKAGEFIEWLLGRYPDKQAALLPVLRLAEEEFGNIDDASVMLVAKTLELSPGYVWGVLTFYTHYRREGDGKYLLQVCSTLPCALRGCREIQHHLEDKLGIEAGETTEDGLFTLKKVECLGSCDTAPVVQVNEKYHENLDSEALDKLLENLRG